MKNIPSTEERVWAVLAHLSALAFGMGILLPILGWSGQRDKSKYASFHCLQALGYQSLGYTIWILFALIVAIIQMLNTFSDLVTAAEAGADFARMMSLAMGGHFLVIIILIGLYMLMPILAAVACGLGREFHYPILGTRLARYVGYDANADTPLSEDHEERFVAAMGHFAVIILLWGMLAPFTAWALQGGRSLFLKFQSVQTLVYQALGTLLFFGAGLLYFFGFAIFLGTFGFSNDPEINETTMIGLAVFGLSMLCMFAIVLIVPFLHILGQWAGYRILKGDEYRYPIVGRVVEKRIGKAYKGE